MADIDVKLIKEYDKTLESIEMHIDKIVNGVIQLDKSSQNMSANLGKGAKATKKDINESDKIAKQLAQREAKLKQLEDSRAITIAKVNEKIKQRNQSLREEAKFGKVAEDSLVRQRQKLRDLTKQYDAASAAQRQKLGPAVKELSKQIEQQEKATNRNQRAVGRYSDAMASAPGPIGRATTAVKTFGVAMKTAAGPIIILVGAITGIIKAMARSEEGANRLKRVMAVLSGAFGAILDVVTDFGIKAYDAIVTNPKKAINDLWQIIKKNLINRVQAIPELFTAVFNTVVGTFQFLGNKIKGIIADIPLIGKGIDADEAAQGATDALLKIEEGAEDTGKALIKMATGLDETQLGAIAKGVSNLGKEIKNDADESLRLAKVREDLLKVEREWVVERARLTTEISKARAALDDENIPLEEKIRLNEEALRLTDKLLEGEDKLRQLRLTVAQEQAAINASDSDALNEIALLEAEQITAEEERNNRRKRLLAERKRLLNEALTAEKSFLELNLELEKEFTAELDAELQKQIDDYNAAQEAKNEAAEKNRDVRQAIMKAGEEIITQVFTNSQNSQIKALEDKKNRGEISEKEFEKEREKIEKRAATRNKLIQVGKISLELFEAIASLNPIKITAATGALVGALATPAYAMGTDYAEKRFIAGEAGFELGRKRDGSFVMFDSPTLVDDPSFIGAKIWNHGESKQILSGDKQNDFNTREIVKAIERKPETSFSFDASGIRKTVTVQNNIITWLEGL